MKKILFSAFFAVVCMASAHGQWCGESRYTEAQIDSIVTAMRDSIPRMIRADYIRIDDIKLEFAVMRSLTPAQRTRFWLEKLDEVMTLDWNDAERTHIRKMRNYIAENGSRMYSDDCPKEQREKTQKFAEEWQKYGEEQLKWDPTVIYGIAWKIHRMTDKDGTLDLPYLSCMPDDKPA